MRAHPRQVTLPLPPGNLCTYTEAAVLLGVSATTVRHYVKEGMLEARYLSPRVVRISTSEVTRLRDELDRGARGPNRSPALGISDYRRSEETRMSRLWAVERFQELRAVQAVAKGEVTDEQLQLINNAYSRRC